MLRSIINENRRVFPPCRTRTELLLTKLCGVNAATHGQQYECYSQGLSCDVMGCDVMHYSSETQRLLPGDTQGVTFIFLTLICLPHIV